MPLVGHMDFFESLRSERVCWIRGAFRSHKTSLAYAIAIELLKQGKVKEIASNISDVFDEDLSKPPKDMAIILDEPGRFLNYVDQVRAINSFSAKQGLYYLIPGKIRPHADLRNLVVQVLFDFGQVGLNFILYKWEQGEDNKNKYGGSFLWVNQAEVYGLYSTGEGAESGGRIWETIQKYYGKGLKPADRFDTLADNLDGLANRLQSISDTGFNGGKGRRR